jgi:hypothetical protein
MKQFLVCKDEAHVLQLFVNLHEYTLANYLQYCNALLCVWVSEFLNAVIFNASPSHVCHGSEDNSLMKPPLWMGMYWFNSETLQQRFLAVCNFDPLHLNLISWSCLEIMNGRNKTDLMQCQITSSWCTSSGHQITNAINEIKIWCCTLLLEATPSHPFWHWAQKVS